MILYAYGAGRFGKEVMDLGRRVNATTQQWSAIKYLDDHLPHTHKYGAEVVRLESILAAGALAESEFIISAGEPEVRKKMLARLTDLGARLAVLIDRSSLVVESAVIEPGVLISPFCVISSDAVLEQNVAVNISTLVGHDVRVGRNSVLSSMVNIGGGCTIGENTYVGMGSLIKEDVKIGANSIIGMGSVVFHNIPDGVIALGNPARPMRPNTEKKIFK